MNIADEINKLHAAVGAALRQSVNNAIRIGELLSKQKQTLEHGEWGPWLKANIKFSRATATNYMRIHKNRRKIKLLKISKLSNAYELVYPKPREPRPEDDIKPADDPRKRDALTLMLTKKQQSEFNKKIERLTSFFSGMATEVIVLKALAELLAKYDASKEVPNAA